MLEARNRTRVGPWLAAAALLAMACHPPADTVEPQAAVAPVAAPMFLASSLDVAPQDITTNTYGAFSTAPEATAIGDRVADFELPQMDGGRFALADARAKGPVAIVFFRGFW